MSKIDEMLKNEKVELMVLGDIGEFYGGLTGKNKNDFTDGNAKYVTYKNVYANPSTLLYIDDKVKINEGENQRKLEYGDIIFTGSSETADECGLSSVITSEPKEDLYLNSFCFLLRLNDKNLLLPDFAKHLFRSHRVRKQIIMTASGVTRFNVSKQLMGQVEIPIPSLETQEKIAKALDKFTNYLTELQSELQSRNRQYEYYRDKLLSEEYLNKAIINYYKSDNTRYLSYEKITDICLRQRGIKITAKEMNELNNNFSSVKVFAGGNTSAMLNKDEVGEENVINKPSVIVKSRGNIDFEYYDKEFTHKNEMWSYSSLDESKLNIKYLYYILKNNLKYFRDNAISGKLPQIATGVTDNYKIPLPNIYIQDQVVEILDKFQELTQNVSGLLPDEIEKRQKQYEYYREKLLTFDTERTRGGVPPIK